MAEKKNNEFEGLEEVAALEIPTYSLKSKKTGDVILVKALGEIVSIQKLDEKTRDPKVDPKTGAPEMLHTTHVVDSDGEEGEMVLPFLIHKAFTKATESGPLAGRFFRLVKGGSETGKTTKWDVREMAPAKKA